MSWSDDELDEREYPDEDDDDLDDDGDDPGAPAPTRECPRCGVDVYDDAEQCPLCGTWLTADTSVWTGRAWWWLALGIVGIGGLVVILALGGL